MSGSNVDIVTARFTAAGDLDTAFDGDGVIYFDYGQFDLGTTVLLQQVGSFTKIVTVGGSLSSLGQPIIVARYNDDGSPDTTFAADGVRIFALGVEVFAAVIEKPDKIIVVGTYLNDFYAFRLLASGVLDQSFGTNAFVRTNVGGSDFPQDVAVQGDGKILILITGSTFFSQNNNYDLASVRYLNNGTLDTTFDNQDGIAVTDLGSLRDEAYAIAIQPDNRIVLAGTTKVGDRNDTFVLRFRGDRLNAATATISGRLVDTSGYGIHPARVYLSGGDYNDTRIAIVNGIGYYNFYNVDVTTSTNPYVVTPDAKSYIFAPSQRTLFPLTSNVGGVDFTGDYE